MSAPKPGTPEWRAVVTASKIAPILGLSPWDSPLSMWLKMAGRLEWESESRAMKRGNMLENAVLDWWLEEHPEHVEIQRQEWWSPEDWCGATPDLTVMSGGVGEFVDAKTAGRDDDWGRPDDPDAVPAYYYASSMWQLAMAPGVQRVHLAVLFGSPFDLVSYTIERDEEVCGLIVERAREFYDSLSGDVVPPLSGMACEYDALRKSHPDIDRDLTVTIPDDLADEFAEAYWATRRLDSIRARVLDAMGNARFGVDSTGTRIARRQPKGAAVELRCIAPAPTTEETEAA